MMIEILIKRYNNNNDDNSNNKIRIRVKYKEIFVLLTLRNALMLR